MGVLDSRIDEEPSREIYIYVYMEIGEKREYGLGARGGGRKGVEMEW